MKYNSILKLLLIINLRTNITKFNNKYFLYMYIYTRALGPLTNNLIKSIYFWVNKLLLNNVNTVLNKTIYLKTIQTVRLPIIKNQLNLFLMYIIHLQLLHYTVPPQQFLVKLSIIPSKPFYNIMFFYNLYFFKIRNF
jgi:hypothetical protein